MNGFISGGQAYGNSVVSRVSKSGWVWSFRVAQFQLQISTYQEAMEFSSLIAKSQFAPGPLRGRPEDCFLAMQFGGEIGLKPLQSLQNVSVINGKPSIWGDAALALVKCASDFEAIHEFFEEDSRGTLTAFCTVKRKSEEAQTRSFSVDDAKQAGLWGKHGANGYPTPWVTYPKRMLQMRARSFALRDVFPHVLKGLILAEEAMDYIDVEPEREQPQPQAPQTQQAIMEQESAALLEKLKAAIQPICAIPHMENWAAKHQSEIDTLTVHHRNDFRACYKAHLQSIRTKLQPEATRPKESQTTPVDEVEKPTSVHVLRALSASLGRVRLIESLQAWPEKHNGEIEQLNPGHKAELDRAYKRKTELLAQPPATTEQQPQPAQTETAKPSDYEALKTALIDIENNPALNKWALSNRQSILALSAGEQQHILDIFADLQETFAAAA